MSYLNSERDVSFSISFCHVSVWLEGGLYQRFLQRLYAIEVEVWKLDTIRSSKLNSAEKQHAVKTTFNNYTVPQENPKKEKKKNGFVFGGFDKITHGFLILS